MLNLTDALKVVTDCLVKSFSASDALACLIELKSGEGPVLSLAASSGQTQSESFDNAMFGLRNWRPLLVAVFEEKTRIWKICLFFSNKQKRIYNEETGSVLRCLSSDRIE